MTDGNLIKNDSVLCLIEFKIEKNFCQASKEGTIILFEQAIKKKTDNGSFRPFGFGGKTRKKNVMKFFLYAAGILIFILPVLNLVQMSFLSDDTWSLTHYRVLFDDPRTWGAIQNTLAVSVFSTAVSAVLGVFFAVCLAYTNIKRKKILELLILLPYIIPSYVTTLSWSTLFAGNGAVNAFLSNFGLPEVNVYSRGGIIFIIGICNSPVVYFMTVNMLRKIPQDLEWAARVSGYSKWQTLRKISLAQAKPAIIGGSILVFLSSIDNFSVPAFLGIPSGITVLSTYIYEKTIGFGPGSFHQAAALSVILSAVAILGVLFQRLFIKKSSNSESIQLDYSERILLSKRGRAFLGNGLLLFLVLLTILPLLSMVASSFKSGYTPRLTFANGSIENYRFLFANNGVSAAVRTSLLLALVCCAVCILFGTMIAYLKVRKGNQMTRLLETGASLTYALPGIVLSLAMIFYWSAIPNVYGTLNILVIAYITRYLVLQIKGSTAAVLAVHPELEEAAAVSGSRGPRIWRRILIPLLKIQVFSSTFLIFTSAVTELTLSSILSAAGTKTIGLTIFNYQQSGSYNLAQALSTLVACGILLLYLLIWFIGSKNKGGKKDGLVH